MVLWPECYLISRARITSDSIGSETSAGSLANSRKRTRPRWSADFAAASLAPVIDATSSSEWPSTSFSNVEGFKTGDFDTVRAMLADDVKLDLVAKLRKQGKSEVGEYYARYAACEQWAFAAGVVDSRAAMLVYDREVSLETPAYFVALDFDGNRVVSIHDFLFARYAMDGVDLSPLNLAQRSQ